MNERTFSAVYVKTKTQRYVIPNRYRKLVESQNWLVLHQRL